MWRYQSINKIENCIFKMASRSLRRQWVNGATGRTLEELSHVDELIITDSGTGCIAHCKNDNFRYNEDKSINVTTFLFLGELITKYHMFAVFQRSWKGWRNGTCQKVAQYQVDMDNDLFCCISSGNSALVLGIKLVGIILFQITVLSCRKNVSKMTQIVL